MLYDAEVVAGCRLLYDGEVVAGCCATAALSEGRDELKAEADKSLRSNDVIVDPTKPHRLVAPPIKRSSIRDVIDLERPLKSSPSSSPFSSQLLEVRAGLLPVSRLFFLTSSSSSSKAMTSFSSPSLEAMTSFSSSSYMFTYSSSLLTDLLAERCP